MNPIGVWKLRNLKLPDAFEGERTMSGTVKVAWSLSIGLVGCRHEGVEEFDAEEWESMSEDEKDEAVRDVAFERIDWNYYVEGED